jgi:phosphoglucomutase
MLPVASAGKPAEAATLVNVSRLITAYYSDRPDPSVASQRVVFGTSGHRDSAFEKAFNEWHILAITQAICLYRERQKIDGPLFLGMDTHALSVPALASALEGLAANRVDVIYAESFQDAEHLSRLLDEARSIVSETLSAAPMSERERVEPSLRLPAAVPIGTEENA